MFKDKKISVIIAAAGSAKRMGGGLNKQYIVLDGMPVLARSVDVFERNPLVDEIVIVVKAGEEERCRSEIVEAYGFKKVSCVMAGGSERQYSVRAALAALDPECGYVLVHDGARPLVSDETVDAVIFTCIETGAAVPAVPVKDTIKEVALDMAGAAPAGAGADVPDKVGGLVVLGTPDRSRLRAVQTPQGFEKALLDKAYGLLDGDDGVVVTDDASLVEALGHPVSVVEGEEKNIKITTPADVKKAEIMMGEVKVDMMPRVGMGYDVHAFAEGRKCILGGVDIPHEKGLAGHSDADVLVHAIMDSLLGACALGDIGRHFPDTDP
ncbi:MAG: 2-C-methyl-D-erythritol 4-phosphate cytidylyltransferase, partial [Firmicutes bacterium]|nr:2-C-methyl-D-erythritol 4-phosphate cytidylyltransferase [Bacillota bacterium]